MFLGEFLSLKKGPHNQFEAQIGDPLGTTPYAFFLQNFIIFGNAGFSASLSGPFRAAFSLGFQLLRLYTLGFLWILYTSTTCIYGVLVVGGGGVSVEFVISSNGISLWRMVNLFA